jgi:hypothetical protein
MQQLLAEVNRLRDAPRCKGRAEALAAAHGLKLEKDVRIVAIAIRYEFILTL